MPYQTPYQAAPYQAPYQAYPNFQPCVFHFPIISKNIPFELNLSFSPFSSFLEVRLLTF